MFYCRIDNGKELIKAIIICTLSEARALVDKEVVRQGKYDGGCYIVYL